MQRINAIPGFGRILISKVGKSNAIGGAQFTVIFPVDEVKDE